MVVDKKEYTNEGLNAKMAIVQLHIGLINRYNRIGMASEGFEREFIDDMGQLPQLMETFRMQLPPFKREYIDFYLVKLSEMEDALVNLESYVSRHFKDRK